MAAVDRAGSSSVHTRDPNVVRLKRHQKISFQAISDAVTIEENELDNELDGMYRIMYVVLNMRNYLHNFVPPEQGSIFIYGYLHIYSVYRLRWSVDWAFVTFLCV